jgi:hypothetical protein
LTFGRLPCRRGFGAQWRKGSCAAGSKRGGLTKGRVVKGSFFFPYMNMLTKLQMREVLAFALTESQLSEFYFIFSFFPLFYFYVKGGFMLFLFTKT